MPVGLTTRSPLPGSHILTPLFPVPLPLHLGLPMKGRRLTVGAVAHARDGLTARSPTFSPPCFRFLYLYTLDYQ